VAIDSQGKLCVVDTGNCRVERFETDGRLLNVIGGAGTGPGLLKDPFTVAVARDGSLLVCEYGNHRVSQFSDAGAFLRTYGGPGRDPGQFSGPRGVAVSTATGALFVADTGNDRVQRIEIEAPA
jgi:DNA-binding beta-propeller fold protein YncE